MHHAQHKAGCLLQAARPHERNFRQLGVSTSFCAGPAGARINITARCSAEKRDDDGLGVSVPTMVTKAPEEGACTHSFLLHSADTATHTFLNACHLRGVRPTSQLSCHHSGASGSSCRWRGGSRQRHGRAVRDRPASSPADSALALRELPEDSQPPLHQGQQWLSDEDAAQPGGHEARAAQAEHSAVEPATAAAGARGGRGHFSLQPGRRGLPKPRAGQALVLLPGVSTPGAGFWHHYLPAAFCRHGAAAGCWHTG